MENFADGASADSLATLTDGELGALLESDGVDQFDGEGHVVTRHNHLDIGRKRDAASDIGGAEEELRTIAV